MKPHPKHRAWVASAQQGAIQFHYSEHFDLLASARTYANKHGLYTVHLGGGNLIAGPRDGFPDEVVDYRYYYDRSDPSEEWTCTFRTYDDREAKRCQKNRARAVRATKTGYLSGDAVCPYHAGQHRITPVG